MARLLIVLVLVVAACGASSDAARMVGDATDAATTTTLATTTVASTTTTTMPPAEGIVISPPGGLELYEFAGDKPFATLHEGVAMGVQFRSGDWLEVTDPCNNDVWILGSDVDLIPRAEPAAAGPGFDLSDAVIMLDPGHGGRDWGAVGSTGMRESHLNSDIAQRARTLLLRSNDINFTTGEITPGMGYRAVEAVFLTRDSEGPEGGDFEAGLAFRAELGNRSGADVFVSIHNNSVPLIDVELPGTEVYYSVASTESRRLAAILYEEMLLSLGQFDVDWRGGPIKGARARVDSETGEDYYGLLRRAETPAAIVEGAYLTNPEEEALMATDAFRDAYAEALYRGIVRFLTTTDPGSGINSPEQFVDDAGTTSTSSCKIPLQP
ncbi:MAG: N-acetylmuramoyl-L-alanine amidase [Acidimicrobiia bacterium]|nr:N-acetylmuramoyl-L-alanine amidase [Acidimicrobiia bacterium]